jgi:hypothetical protein
MTEAEWNSCADPEPMLEFLRGRAGDRKLRLFAAACCRRIWSLLPAQRSRRAVEAVEAFADGVAARGDLEAAREAAIQALAAAPFAGAASSAAAAAYEATAADLRAGRRRLPALVPAWGEAAGVADHAAEAVASEAADGPGVEGVPKQIAESARRVAQVSEQRRQANLLRCVFGNPCVAIPGIAPSLLKWNDGCVPRIARGIYDERVFDRMGILADALLDAGCDNEELLTHCRQQEAIHVRGCWAIDLLLNKE